MNMQIKADDKLIKEYDHPVLFMVFNEDNCEVIGPQVMMNDAEKYGNQVHLVLALHHCLAHAPEIIQKAVETFDNYVMEKSETPTIILQ